jgi:hypothetical protein
VEFASGKKCVEISTGQVRSQEISKPETLEPMKQEKADRLSESVTQGSGD